MKISSKDFRVRPGGKVKLGEWGEREKPRYARVGTSVLWRVVMACVDQWADREGRSPRRALFALTISTT